MQRRLALATLACWPAAHLLAREGGERARHKVGAGELHAALARRFPLRFGVPGLLEVELDAAGLLLLPARNRLGAVLQAELGGAQGARLPSGEMDIAFALRYEASDRSVRAHDPEILDVRWPGLPRETVRRLRDLSPMMAEGIGEVVLHRFTPRELALPDTMGLQPRELQVVEDGLLVFFGNKPG
jgi:hypothetical protein